MLTVALRHRFADFAFDVAFTAPTPGTTVLFGPSGSGKSTIIAAIAGLLRPLSGRIVIDETVLLDTERGLWLPPERRGLGVVFQDGRLFPHLSVTGNLRFGERRARQSRDQGRGIGLADIVDLLGLAPLLTRRPIDLSGGERQRVAIGRALLAHPRLLLMDEPLANLDGPRKTEILPYLMRLKTELRLPIVYVTHAPDEVARLGDTLVLLDAGRCMAAGPLSALVGRADLPLATRDDAAAILDLRIEAHDRSRRLTTLAGDGICLLVPIIEAAVGAHLRVRIPAREVILATTAPVAISLHNILASRVRLVAEDASRSVVTVELAVGPHTLLARVTPDAVARLGLSPGAPVLALIKSSSVERLNA